MKIGSLTSAAQTALNGLGNVIRDVEKVAEHVAGGIADDPGANFSGGLSELAKLPDLKHQARANVKVFNNADELLSDLANMPRR